MDKIGFSTGALYKIFPSTSLESIRFCLSQNPDVIEVCCKTIAELDQLKENIKAIKTEVEDCSNIFIHAPTHGTNPAERFYYQDDADTVKVLVKLWLAFNQLNPRHIVFHPDSIKDFKVFYKLRLPMLFENSEYDDLKYRKADDLRKLITLFIGTNTNPYIVLDLAHILSWQGSMMETRGFLRDNIAFLIKEIHISGFDQQAGHIPLHLCGQDEIIRSLSPFLEFKIPVIIESVCKNETQAVQEINYIREKIKSYSRQDFRK